MSGHRRAHSPGPGYRLSDEQLTKLRKYADELDACNGSRCLMYLNRLQELVGSTARSIGSSMRNSAYTAALALANRTAPHDVTPATSATPEKPLPHVKPLPYVKMYDQPSKYDQQMNDLRYKLERISDELGLLQHRDPENKKIKSLIVQQDDLNERLLAHVMRGSGGKSKRRSKRSKQSKQSKRVSSKRGLTKRRKH